MICYRAAWVLPIGAPPLRDGWVVVDGGRVVKCGSGDPRRLGHDSADEHGEQIGHIVEHDLGDAAILPGLVNAHTHLELSYLRGEVPPGSTFVEWIRSVMAARSRGSDPAAPEILEAIQSAIDESLASGTALVGDISNSLVTVDLLTRSPLAALVFYELIRFNAPDPDALVRQALDRLGALALDDRVRASLAAHAPYSVGPGMLRGIRAGVERGALGACSVHLSESTEEVEFILTGTGPWRALLEGVGSWDPAWVAPGVTPVEYLDQAGFLGPMVLAVHGVQMVASDLERLGSHGATLVTCPRSNGYTGAGVPPIEEFYRSGVRVAVGTDSLASTADLNVFAELAAMRQLAPLVPASALLDSATRQGARALGFGGEYGVIERGSRARLDRKSTRLNSSHIQKSRMPSSA